MKKFIEQIKKTIVFISRSNKEEDIFATAFLVNFQGVNHLATARHVIDNSDMETLHAFINTKDKKMTSLPLKQIRVDGFNWIVHPSNTVDIAMVPFPLHSQYDSIAIPESMCLRTSSLSEITDVFYLSFQPNLTVLAKDKRINPIIRKGMISRINSDTTFYIDGFAFPGNSGSPVFMIPSPARISELGGFEIGNDELGGKFVGLVGEYQPYQDCAVSQQTGLARVIFEENTGLSKVWSYDYFQQISHEPGFKTQADQIKDKVKKSAPVIETN